MQEANAFAVGHRAGSLEIHELANQRRPRPDLGPPIETGLVMLDWALNGGLRAGKIMVIGARSGHGKSSLADQIALHVSRSLDVTYFALEEGRAVTTDRLVAKIMRTDEQSAHNAIVAGKAISALKTLATERKIIVEERNQDGYFSLDHALEMMYHNRPKVVVFDHLQFFDDWLTPADRGERGDMGPIRFCNRLPGIAREFKCAIIAVHQTKNALQYKRPTQHDLADTIRLSQVSDVVAMIHRPFRGQGRLSDVVAEVNVDKNRLGYECLLHFEWDGRLRSYRDMTPDQEESLACCKAKPKHGERV